MGGANRSYIAEVIYLNMGLLNWTDRSLQDKTYSIKHYLMGLGILTHAVNELAKRPVQTKYSSQIQLS